MGLPGQREILIVAGFVVKRGRDLPHPDGKLQNLEMRVVVQRVSRAQVSVGEEVVGKIGPGLLVLLGVAKSDTPADAELFGCKDHRHAHL